MGLGYLVVTEVSLICYYDTFVYHKEQLNLLGALFTFSMD